MMEKRFYAVPPQLFAVDGTTDGVVNITAASDPCSLFKVKMKVYIAATGLPNLELEIKQIHNGLIYVGPLPYGKPGVNTSIDARTDISAYTVALGANIFADLQKRPAIGSDETQRAIYEEEPTVAVRSVLVDECGNKINETNPLPVAATFDGTVQVGDIRITACDDDPKVGDKHSSVRIAGTDCANEMNVNPDGSINVNILNSTNNPGLNISHAEISSVASGVETTIITIVASGNYRVQKVEVSGDNFALFRVKVNGTTVSNKRSWYSDFNQTFNYEDFANGLLLTVGQVLTVTVLHNRPFLGNFEATVMAN